MNCESQQRFCFFYVQMQEFDEDFEVVKKNLESDIDSLESDVDPKQLESDTPKKYLVYLKVFVKLCSPQENIVQHSRLMTLLTRTIEELTAANEVDQDSKVEVALEHAEELKQLHAKRKVTLSFRICFVSTSEKSFFATC